LLLYTFFKFKGKINNMFKSINKFSVFDYIVDDKTILERDPLETLASQNQLSAFKHHGFWQPMDTLRDKNLLEEYYSENKFIWKK
jgi:glucose-1-phosphate cytidylyltransferase